MARRHTKRRYRRRFTRRGGGQPTFHLLLTSSGEQSLQKRLEMLKEELKEGDAVTVVFDGEEAQKNSNYNDGWKSGFRGTVNVTTEKERTANWGHKLRSKYQGKLEPKTTFVIHGSDEDEYNPGFLQKLRESCSDPETLYMREEGGSANAIIPYDLVGKSEWQPNTNGEAAYYQAIKKHAKNVGNLSTPINSNVRKRGEPQNYIFYHVYCNKYTQPVVKDQVSKIIFSGLYQHINSIKCFLAGEKEHMAAAEAFLKDSGNKFIIEERGEGDSSFERFTLNQIPKYVTEADKFLYLHTKGVSEKHAANDNIYWWRTWMEYNLIHRYEYCLEILDDYDIVGVGYTRKMIGPHFSGNFWWTKGSYFATLPKNADGGLNIGNGYLDPENFIFKGKNPKHIDIDEGRAPNPDTDYYSFKPGMRAANRSYKRGGRRTTRRMKGGSESKTIDTVALLIPTYPKHYQVLYELLNKLKSNGINIDVHVVFSNKEEYEQFELKDSIKPMILENVPQDRSIVEYKKFAALKRMINTVYDYIIVCDSETDIVPENFTKENILAKVNARFNNKKLYAISAAGDTFLQEIMTISGSVFTGEDHTKLKSATRDFTLYTFFYDIPVYKREHIQGFLDKINYETLKITWHHFDTLVYDYYLAITKGFEVIDISAFAHDRHGAHIKTIEDLNKIKELGFGFGSVVGSLWREKKDILAAERTFLLINIDRA